MDIKHVPINSLTVNQLVKLDYNDFVENLFRSGYSGIVKYVDGIILTHYAYPDNIETTREEMKGHYNWSYVEFAKSEFVKELTLNGNQNLKIQVIDVSRNEVFAEFAKWLKTQKVWSEK